MILSIVVGKENCYTFIGLKINILLRLITELEIV